MEGIMDAIKSVVIFVLVFRIVRNLFVSSSYVKYFRFLEGIMIVILLMAPVFSWLGEGNGLDRCLEDNWFQVELEWDQRELERIGEQRDEMLANSWKKSQEVETGGE